MNWVLSDGCDPEAKVIADRHYNRGNPDSAKFTGPGRTLVLKCEGSVWVTSWPFAQYVRHAWAGAWVNSCFRRESGPLASELIREAIAATRWYWPDVPALGMVTFVDPTKVRHKRDLGRCYRRAGFIVAGQTKVNKLLCLQLLPDAMPDAEMPHGANGRIIL